MISGSGRGLGAIALVGLALAAASSKAVVLGGIHGYQRTLSPLSARIGLRCRFTPSCSRYAEIVIARDGVFAGGWKAARRIARCGPWTPVGSIDDP